VLGILNLFRISGTTPGNRHPPAAELSNFDIWISAPRGAELAKWWAQVYLAVTRVPAAVTLE
jgi:hypothetical protein